MPDADRPIVWSPEADEDLVLLWIYLAALVLLWIYLAAEASDVVADRRLSEIERTIAKLAQWPQSGRARDDLLPGLRSLPAVPQVVFYRVRDDAVEIVRVLHGRRDIEAVFSKPEP